MSVLIRVVELIPVVGFVGLIALHLWREPKIRRREEAQSAAYWQRCYDESLAAGIRPIYRRPKLTVHPDDEKAVNDYLKKLFPEDE